MTRHTYLTLMTPEEARKRWFDRLQAGRHVLPAETVPLARAFRRVLAAPVAARRSSPAFHGAAMDGIAVRADATFAASARSPLRLELDREAFWINTGRPLPEGCNAVIMVEHVNVSEDGRHVIIEKPAFPWQHVRKMGEDIVATEIILPQGTPVGPYELGALAAGGATEVSVFVRPRVFIIPSGSEIVPLDEARDEDLQSGRVLPEFNSLVFSAMIEEAGGEAVTRPIVPDEPEAIAAALRAALDEGADLVLLNAGSSAGSHDYSAEVMASLGEVLTHGVSVMPGKPTVLGAVGATPVVGTPGYPVSAIVAMETFVQPLLLLWQGRGADELARRRETVEAIPCNPLPSRPGMEELIRVRLGLVDDAFVAVPLSRGAGTVSSLSRADGIIRVLRDCEGLDAGVPARVELLRSREQIAGALLAVGSHDNALELLDSLLRKRSPRFRLTSAHVGSLGGLQALRRGQCHLTGTHLLDEESGVYNRKAIAENLAEPVVLVRLADREQGLITAPGNPLELRGVEDLAREGVRFINRQRGSGTRVLLDYRLAKLGISPRSIVGYQDEEYTHMNVAAAVLSGRADVGLGVRSAANALGLPFLPVGVEEYDLAIPRRFWDDERIRALLDVVRGEEFRGILEEMGGYGTARTGEVVWEYDGGQGGRD